MADATELAAAMRAALQLEEARMRGSRAEEARLRAALAELYRPPDWTADATIARHTGADRAWDRWVGREKERLNMELARLLAARAHVEARLKRAFGRAEAAAALAADDRRAAEARRRQAKEAALRDAMLLRGAGQDRNGP